MNKDEWITVKHKDYTYKHKTEQLLNEWKQKYHPNEICDAHHRDDNDEVREYNKHHYELWGFEIDENGETHFEEGKYIIFMTRSEHMRHHSSGRELSEESRKKISEWHKRAYADKTNHPMYGKPGVNLGKKFSEETKRKMSEAHKGKTPSAGTRKKMSEANKGKTHSAETRAKMSEAHKGKTPSAETLAKISATKQHNKALYEEYKANGGTLSKKDFLHALKIGDITVELLATQK